VTSTPEPQRTGMARAARSVEAAAIAGLAHSALSLIATWLLLRAPDPGEGAAVLDEWYSDGGNQRKMILGLNLLVMSSIAFLWFVAVIRRRVGDRENRFFGTVFFGSGLLLSGAWLAAGVLAAAPALAASTFDLVPGPDTIAALQAAAVGMASVVATRLEAVFIVSTTTVGRLSGAMPRWLVVSGYVIGLVLLIAPVPNVASVWVFPIWVAVASAAFLVRRELVSQAGAGGALGDGA